jgi:hypothetical protein
MDDYKTEMIGVEGIVVKRNKQPYILIFRGKTQIGQMTMTAARNFAHDILNMCARTEADAMIFKFFEKVEFPEQAAAAAMLDFRVFRLELDKEVPDTSVSVPSSDMFDFTKKKVQ